MSFQPVGDLAGAFRLRYLNADLKKAANRLGGELASGRSADVTQQLHGGLDRLAAVRRAATMTDAYRVNAGEIQNRISGMQAALQTIGGVASRTGVQMLAAATTPTRTNVDAAAASAKAGLETAIGALNANLAGQSLFSGTAVDRPAMVSATEVLDQLSILTVGATSAAQVATIVGDYFNLPGGGFETSAYRGSTQAPGPLGIAETESATVSLTARDPALRKSLEGLSVAALLSRGILAGQPDEQGRLLTGSGETLVAANDAVIGLQAGLGATEARIEVVQATNAANRTRLGVMLDEMTGVNGYETATSLKAVELRLEALYIATARLSQLSMVNYLR